MKSLRLLDACPTLALRFGWPVRFAQFLRLPLFYYVKLDFATLRRLRFVSSTQGPWHSLIYSHKGASSNLGEVPGEGTLLVLPALKA